MRKYGIWVRINAEIIQYGNRILNGVEKEMGDLNTPHSPMWVSKNQLTYDEFECEVPRLSIEELLLNSIPEIFEILKNPDIKSLVKNDGLQQKLKGYVRFQKALLEIENLIRII